MKKALLIALAAGLLLSPGCKKEKQEAGETPLAKKYARYKVQSYQDKDLAKWAATLEKAEAVDLLKEEKYVSPKNKAYDLSYVKLADDKKVYVESRHLADRPIVFTDENTKVYVRPSISSKVYGTVPRGTIGFIVDEKAEWVQVFVGKVGAKWITAQWIKDGYSADETLVQEAKEYEAVAGGMDAPEIDEGTMKKIREKLAELGKGTSVIAELARKKLEALDGAPSGEGGEKMTEQPKEENPLQKEGEQPQ
ncbi:MAG TPA: hypothetical protein ENN21_06090 [Spirochaetes bacterium]|nr:hypothetical protein [Spirochaetota bacterium]